MPLVARVRRTIRRYDLATARTRVVAAVSGGPDSVALVHLLRELDRAGDLHVVALAHLNHQLRDEADADEGFCRELATSVALPFASERVDVRALAAAERRSLEDAAHHARYAFFDRVRVAQVADVVALGHTIDDQAETFLLRLLRGAGSRGLGAMHPRAGTVIRPLLECRRAELRAFLDARGAAFVHDASNDDLGIPRNRVRAELLPLLARRFNPNIAEVLAHEAELARTDEDYLHAIAAGWWDRHVSRQPSGWSVDASALSALPVALGRRVLHIGLNRLAGGRAGFTHVDEAWAVVTGASPAVDLPGQRLERVGGSVVLTGRGAAGRGRAPTVRPGGVPAFCYHLDVPGEVPVPELGCHIVAEVAERAPATAPAQGQVSAMVPLAALKGAGLAVRNRRPGDRLRATRMGRRKLQDLLVDRKVPRHERDRIPIVVDAEGRIVWVAGYALDWEFRVTDPAQAVVILRVKAVGGSC